MHAVSTSSACERASLCPGLYGWPSSTLLRHPYLEAVSLLSWPRLTRIFDWLCRLPSRCLSMEQGIAQFSWRAPRRALWALPLCNIPALTQIWSLVDLETSNWFAPRVPYTVWCHYLWVLGCRGRYRLPFAVGPCRSHCPTRAQPGSVPVCTDSHPCLHPSCPHHMVLQSDSLAPTEHLSVSPRLVSDLPQLWYRCDSIWWRDSMFFHFSQGQDLPRSLASWSRASSISFWWGIPPLTFLHQSWCHHHAKWIWLGKTFLISILKKTVTVKMRADVPINLCAN